MSMIPEKPPFKLLDILYKKEFILFVVLVSILIINSNISPYFLDLYNLIDSTIYKWTEAGEVNRIHCFCAVEQPSENTL